MRVRSPPRHIPGLLGQSWSGHMCEATNQFFSPCPPLPLSVSQINLAFHHSTQISPTLPGHPRAGFLGLSWGFLSKREQVLGAQGLLLWDTEAHRPLAGQAWGASHRMGPCESPSPLGLQRTIAIPFLSPSEGAHALIPAGQSSLESDLCQGQLFSHLLLLPCDPRRQELP